MKTASAQFVVQKTVNSNAKRGIPADNFRFRPQEVAKMSYNDPGD